MSNDTNTIGQKGLEFFKDKATINQHGVATITQKDYYEFHKAEGIDKPVIEKFHQSEAELLNGGYLYANDLLLQRMKDADKAGKSMDEVNAALRMPKPNETININMKPRAEYRVPMSKEDIAAGKQPSYVTRHSITTIHVDTKKSLDKGIVENCEEAARSLYSKK